MAARTVDRAVVDAEFEDFSRRRDEALRTLDMDYARTAIPGASSDEVRLMALHKARYETTRIAPELRQESRAWLEERGDTRLEFTVPTQLRFDGDEGTK